MAEESIPISVSPETGSSRRKSVSIVGYPSRTSIGTNPRRYSTGKPSSQNKEDNVPNYLRNSTGSCHDMCKYGHAHAFKAKDPIPKRRLKSVSKEQKDIKPIAVQAEGKKTTTAKLMPSPDPKTHAPDPPEVIKWEIVVPSKKVGNPSKRISSANTKVSGNDQKTLASVKLKPLRVKSTSASYDAPVGLTGIRNIEGGTSRRMGAKILKEPAKEAQRSPKVSLSRVAVKKVLPNPTASNSPKPSLGRVISLKARKHKNLKLVSPLKDQNRMSKTELKQPNIEKVQEKTLHVIGAVAENEDLEPVPAGDNVIPSSRSPPVESPESSTGKSEQSPFCDQENKEEESEYTESDEEDYISETDEILKKADGHEASRKGKVVPISPGDKDVAAVKLKFRRGKVVDLQSDETNAPRRLRFRRARVLRDNEDGLNSGARRRNFANEGIEDHEAKGLDLGSESVNLKHQDVQGKKDAQILLNNVIEETASKLVESRKSKVKALVGAFETVISLQDTKPSAQTVT